MFGGDVEKAPSTYVTVVNSDFGCLGGSGTTAGRLVVLQVDGWRTYVLPGLSESADVIGAPRFFTSVYVKNGQLHATSVSYGPDDNQCCPSLREIYRVDLTHKELKPEGRGPNGPTRGIS
jgi:hypothetical protein